MINCFLTNSECTKPLRYYLKTAFVMAPSPTNCDQEIKDVLETINSVLAECSISVKEGALLADQGDYLCNICQHIQGTGFGIAITNNSLIPSKTLSNIYWEKGLMMGFGKPVILVTSNKESIPSDFVRDHTLFYKDKGFKEKLSAKINNIVALGDYYKKIAEVEVDADNFQKTVYYLKLAYLLTGNHDCKNQLENMLSSLKQDEINTKKVIERIRDEVNLFLKFIQ